MSEDKPNTSADTSEVTETAESTGLDDINDRELAAPDDRLEPDTTEAIDDGEDDQGRAVFVREARSLAESQPERAALMWAQASIDAPRSANARDVALTDLSAALKLAPMSRWLLPIARRELLRHRDYEGALEIGYREVELGGDNFGRASILREIAGVERHVNKDLEASLLQIEEAQKLRQGYPIALAFGADLLLEQGNHKGAAETLSSLSNAVSSASERALCLYAAGTLYETRLDDPRAAEEAYSRALASDADHVPALEALCGYYERHKEWPALCRTLERLAELVPDEAHKERCLIQAGAVHLEKTGNLNGAARDLAASTQVGSANPGALTRLAYVYEVNGRSRELVATLRELLALTLEGVRRAEILVRVGRVLNDQLHEVDGAISAYREALEARPGYLPAITSLTSLYRHQQDHDNLLEVLSTQVDGSLPESVRAVRSMERADLLVELGRHDEAIAAYRRALEIDPELRLARWGLRHLLERLERHRELCDELEAELTVSSDVKTRSHLLLKISTLQAGPLADLPRAIATLATRSTEDLSRSIPLELIELYVRAHRHAELVKLLLAQSRDTTDAAESRGWMLQAATILEYRLEEHGRALALYKSVLEREPRDKVAAAGIARIARRLELWSDLVSLHEHELVTDPDRPDAIMIQCEIGRIEHEHLNAPAAGIAAFERALRGPKAWAHSGQDAGRVATFSTPLPREATSLPALISLERLARQQQRWTELIGVLENYAHATEDKKSASDALCRAAEIADWQLDDLELGGRLYGEANGIDPDNGYARYAVVRIRERQDLWAPAAELIRGLIAAAEHPHERCRLQLRLARVMEYRLGQPPDLELYEAAASPGFGDRLRAELVRVRRMLGSADLDTAVASLGERTTDPKLAAAHFLESAEMAQLGAVGSGVETAQRAHDADPDDVAVIGYLERSLWDDAQWSRLGELREKAAQLDMDPTVRTLGLVGAVSAYMEAKRYGDASRAAQECLNFDAYCVPALQALESLASMKEDWREVAALCDRLASACHDPQNRRTFSLRAADLWADRVGESARALSSLAITLNDNPDEEGPFRMAEDLYRQREEHSDLSWLYARRLKVCEDPGRKAELHRRHAALLRDDLHDLPRATAELREVLDLDGDDLDALREVADLLVLQRRWSDAAAALSEVIKVAGDADVRHQARMQQAELFLDRLHEPDRAAHGLDEAAKERPTDTQAAKLRIRLARSIGDWEQARAHLDRLVKETDNVPDRTWALLQLADVARRGLWNEALATKCEADALASACDDSAALELLFNDFRDRNALDKLVSTGEEAANKVGRERGVELRRTLAQILISHLGQPGRARTMVELLLDGGHDDATTRTLYGQALAGEGHGQEAATQFRAALISAPSKIEAYRGLESVQKALGKVHSAAAISSIIDRIDPANSEGVPQLALIKASRVPPGHLDMDSLPLHEALRPLQTLLESVSDYLGEVFPHPTAGAELPYDHPVVEACNQLSRLMGLGTVEVYVGGAKGATARIGHPIAVILSQRLSQDTRTDTFRYWVGSALARAAGAGALVERLSNRELSNLVEALYAGWTVSDPDVKALRAHLGKAIPRNVRKDLKLIPQPTPTDEHWEAYRLGEEQRSQQAGLLLSRNPGQVLADLAEDEGAKLAEALSLPRLSHLLRFATSDVYADLTRRLWSEH